MRDLKHIHYYEELLEQTANELVLKEKGLSILGKLTGMYLVALASQIVFEGIRGLTNG